MQRRMPKKTGRRANQWRSGITPTIWRINRKNNFEKSATNFHPTKKKRHIIIPDTEKEKPQEGTVVALGTGKLDDNGKKVEFNVKVGDKVLISKYGGTEIKIDGENYLIMREDDILGVIG